jgi:hypothetical protein
VTEKDGKRWVDLGGDEISRWGRWECVEPLTDEVFNAEPQDAFEPPFWRNLEALQHDCTEALLRLGHPDPCRTLVYRGDEEWWYVDDPDVPTREQLDSGLMHGRKYGWTHGFEYALRRSEPFSDPWYAARLAELIFIVSRDRSASHQNQLQRILLIGSLVADWNWRRGFKPAILTGNKQRKVLATHRGAAIASKREGVEARRAAISELLRGTKLTGGALEGHLKRKLSEQFTIDASTRTIRRDLTEMRHP